jgi:RNA polymerase sigma-70 factor (ECF subfamily)
MPDNWIVEEATGPEARYTLRESVSLAFMAALQALPPRQRAVLILSDVLDWPARDVGELLGLTHSSVHSALHRARVTMSVRYHGQPAEAAVRPLSDERTQQLLARYVTAWQSADVVGLVALLKEDAAFAMPPASSWYSGRDAIGAFAAVTVFGDEGMFAGLAKGRWQLRPVGANGQPAYVVYQRTEGHTFAAFGLMVLALAGDQVAACTCFIDPTLLPVFGQPLTIEGVDA